MMMKRTAGWILGLITLASSASCTRNPSDQPLVIGIAFETLQTEYWVASSSALKSELAKRNLKAVEVVADGDANRQFEQVNSLLARKVAGIIIAPKDAGTVVPMIKAANRAGVPIVLYNRPPATSEGRSVTVLADNRSITAETVRYLARQAPTTGRRHQAMILIGDLADRNAVARRDGFDDAIQDFADTIEVVARIPTEWNQEKALAGVTNALQKNPEIDLIFTSSDFLLPSIVSALKSAGRYKKIGEAGHVLLAGFDGDATAYRMLQEKYLDADGVQDVEFECAAAVDAVVKLRAGEPVPEMINDPGFVIHQGNLREASARMWGAKPTK